MGLLSVTAIKHCYNLQLMLYRFILYLPAEGWIETIICTRSAIEKQ